MKTLLFLITFSGISFCSNGQLNCFSGVPKSQKIDTIKNYLFTQHTLPVNKIKEAKILSNSSFKTDDFILAWASIKQDNITSFLQTCLKNEEITDTLYCNIFNAMHKVFVVKDKKKLRLCIFEESRNQHDLFITTGFKKEYLEYVINFISKNLQTDR